MGSQASKTCSSGSSGIFDHQTTATNLKNFNTSNTLAINSVDQRLDVQFEKYSQGRIQQLQLFQSSIEGFKNQLIQHQQLLLKFSDFKYILFSWGKDGLQKGVSENYDALKNRRDDNKCKKMYKPSKKLFVKDVMNCAQKLAKKEYSLVSWNCQHFAATIIKEFGFIQK